MELYTLDSDFNKIGVVEAYESAIWSLRYAEYGDFEIHTFYGSSVTANLMSSAYVFDAESGTGMFVEDVEITTDDEGSPMAVFTGRSFESILTRRIVWGKKKVSGKIQDIISALLIENVISPSRTERQISNFVFQSNSDSRLNDYKIENDSPLELYGDNLYDIIKYLCDLFDVGFCITLNQYKQFVFQLYCGEILDGSDRNNRTVLFSPKMENLSSTRYYRSSQNYKNVARIDSNYELKAEQTNEDGTTIVASTPSWVIFPRGSEPLTSGLMLMMQFHAKVNAGATLNINGTGAKPIYYKTSAIGSGVIDGSATVAISYSTSGSGRWVIDSLEQPEEPIQQSRVLIAPIDDPAMGIDRREIFTQVDSVPTEDGMSPEDYAAYMRLQGYGVLRDNCATTEVDGESIPGINYVFGQDFQLGDIVKVENECEIVVSVRIVEYVQSDDENGPSAYPSFSSVYS